MVGFLSAELPALWPESVPETGPEINRIIARVQMGVRERHPRERIFRVVREVGWVGLAILFGLVIAWVSMWLEPEPIQPLSGQSPTSPQVLPTPASSPTPSLLPGQIWDEKVWGETDLNCDGARERFTLSTGTYSTNISGVILKISMEVQGYDGVVWELTPALLDGMYLRPPQVFFPSEGSCEQLLAVSVRSTHNLFGDLYLFRWNGTVMETVLSAPGFPALDPTPPGRITTVQRFAGDENGGECFWTLTTYEWRGADFEQTSQREEAVTCDNFRRTQPTGEIFQAVGTLAGDRFTQIIAQTDLNCDGRFERLLAERTAPSIYEYISPKTYRIILETGGQTVWELPPTEVNGYFFGPEAFSLGGCEHLIAVLEYTSRAKFGHLLIFRWDGVQMVQVLDSPGLPVSPKALISTQIQTPDQPFTISTVEVGTKLVEPDWCENIAYTYEWHENTFIESAKVPVRVKCEN